MCLCLQLKEWRSIALPPLSILSQNRSWMISSYWFWIWCAICYRFKIIKEVGDGTFGSVWRAINKQSGEVVCQWISCFLMNSIFLFCFFNVAYITFLLLEVLILSFGRLQLRKWRKSIIPGRSVWIFEKWR